jgi:hypothetical protein
MLEFPVDNKWHTKASFPMSPDSVSRTYRVGVFGEECAVHINIVIFYHNSESRQPFSQRWHVEQGLWADMRDVRKNRSGSYSDEHLFGYDGILFQEMLVSRQFDVVGSRYKLYLLRKDYELKEAVTQGMLQKWFTGRIVRISHSPTTFNPTVTGRCIGVHHNPDNECPFGFIVVVEGKGQNTYRLLPDPYRCGEKSVWGDVVFQGTTVGQRIISVIS